MKFDQLNEDNYILFAIKYYDNPQSATKEDFYCDLKRFKWIKKLLKKYKTTGDLNVHLLINHFIILYNIFGDATTPMLFFKVPKELWSSMKTFIVFLNRLPDYPRCYIHEIELDLYCMDKLQELSNGKD